MRYIISLAPCVLCLLMIILSALKPNKAYAHRFLPFMAFMALLYLLIDIPFLYSRNYKLLIYADMVSQFVTTSVPALVTIYLYFLQKKAIFSLMYIVTLFPSIFIGTGSIILYLLIGIDNAAEFLSAVDNGQGYLYPESIYVLTNWWTHNLYLLVSMVEMIFFVVYSIRLFRRLPRKFGSVLGYLTGKESIPISAIQAIHFSSIFLCFIVRIVLGRQYALSHAWVPVALYIVIAVLLVPIISASLSPVNETLTLGEVLKFRKAFTRDIPSKLHTPGRFDSLDRSRMSMAQIKYYHTVTAAEDYIRLHKVYFDDTFDMDTAEQLCGVSKRDIAAMIASEYNCNLKDLLYGLRQTVLNGGKI